jgi:CRISPR type III-B/RAMP module-associated protein Cmr3
MDEAVSISFMIVEPMMFRGPGEFDPFIRGTYSKATSLSMPSPSTIAGTLATYCISELGEYASIGGDWVDHYRAVMGADIGMRGPMILLNHELAAEDKLSESFITMEKIKQKCRKELKKLSQKPNSLMELNEYLKREEFSPSAKIERDTRTGLMLEIRGDTPMKRAREGYIYGAEYIDYMKIGGNSVEVVAEVRGEIIKKLSSARKLPVKFGGENRVALLSFQRGAKILNEIKKCLWPPQEEYSGLLALYLATPTLFKGGKKVEEHVKEWIRKINCEFIGITGESETLGGGFRIQDEKRKPIYTSLKPGSIIFLDGNFDLLDIYLNKTLGEANAIGYGTVIPIPIVGHT